MGNKPGAIAVVLGMDPPGLCSTDLSPLPLARQPAAHRALWGQESTAPAASFCSCCHHNVITFPDRLAASPRILYSITLLLESQKYLHPPLSVFPNFCLNLPQEHSGLFWFFFPDNLLISPILASLPAAITIRGQWYRSGSAKNRCQQESRKLQNRRMVFYKGDDSTRKGWGDTCRQDWLWMQTTVSAISTGSYPESKTGLCKPQGQPPQQTLTSCQTTTTSSMVPPNTISTSTDTNSTFQTDVENMHYWSAGTFWSHTTQAHHRPAMRWDARAKLLIQQNLLVCKSTWRKVLDYDLHIGDSYNHKSRPLILENHYETTLI